MSRVGNTIIAKTEDGENGVVIGGHLDICARPRQPPHRLTDERLYGLGACDMKGGVAVALRLAQDVTDAAYDVTYLFYDCEEVASEHNGLKSWLSLAGAFGSGFRDPQRSHRTHCGRGGLPEHCDSRCAHVVCVRIVLVHGWAITPSHNAAEIPSVSSVPRSRGGRRRFDVPRGAQRSRDNRWGWRATSSRDDYTVTINYRYAPNRSADEAVAHAEEVFDGFDVVVVDNAPGQMPGLRDEAVAAIR